MKIQCCSRYLVFLFLLVLSSCDEDAASVIDPSDLQEVTVATGGVLKTVTVSSEAAVIETEVGDISIPEGTFPVGPVITEVREIDGIEGVFISTRYIGESSHLVAVPEKDIEVCLTTTGDPKLKNMKITSALNQSVSILAGEPSKSELCSFTRVSSGSFELRGC